MIIGITGKARSGKDTVANYLASKLGFSTIAYAKVLKDELTKHFNLTNDQLYGIEKDQINSNFIKSIKDGVVTYWTNRDIMQSYGQFMRSIDHNYWINKTFNFIDNNNLTNVIITDVRQFNEALAIKNKAGILVMVNRPNLKSSVCKSSQSHNTETQMDSFGSLIDYYIHNVYDGVDSLYSTLDEFIKTLKKEYSYGK